MSVEHTLFEYERGAGLDGRDERSGGGRDVSRRVREVRQRRGVGRRARAGRRHQLSRAARHLMRRGRHALYLPRRAYRFVRRRTVTGQIPVLYIYSLINIKTIPRQKFDYNIVHNELQ